MTQAHPTILQLVPRLDTGGAELSAIEITDAIVRAGGRAIVATAGGRMEARIAQAGGELLRFPADSKNPARILANAMALRRLITREDIDLVHARSRAPAWSGLIAAHRAGVPFVTTYHGAYNERGRWKRLYNSVMARADRVIANSRYTAELIRTRYATPDERIRVIYRGVDLDSFDPGLVSAERKTALRQSWEIGAHDRVVLNAARLTSWKGQSTLIGAIAQLASLHPAALADVVVILAGDAQGRADYETSLRSSIETSGLNNRVRLVGHCADMPAAYALAGTVVVASIEPEAFGRAAAEAQAMGCQVISTDIGAPPETVLAEPAVAPDETTGWLVPPADEAALARAILAALTAPAAEREARAARARAHVHGSFTVALMQRQTLGVYDELLATTLADTFR